MKILIAAGHLPAPKARHGAAGTSFHLCEYFALKHHLHLLTFATKDGMVGFQREDMSLFASLEIISVTNLDRLRGALTAPMLPLAIAARNSQRYRKRLRAILTEHHFDVVLLDHTAMFQYVADLPGAIVTGGNAHDIVMQSWARRAAAASNPIAKSLLTAEASRLRSWERETFSKLDFVLVPSEKDKSLLLELQPKATVLVIDPWVSPTASDSAAIRESGSMLFWGAMNRAENIDAARWAVHEILPRIRQAVPNAKLYIAGTHGEMLACEFEKRDDVIVTGFVKDVAPLMARMEVALLPLRQGAGIKIKTLECMTAGLPVVTTAVGEEGVGGTNGTHYLVAENAEELATHAIQLLSHPDQARNIGDNAKHFMEKRQNFAGRLSEVELFLEERVMQSRAVF
jgi:glycosyltransferase involved in cell wall biosynthesis